MHFASNLSNLKSPPSTLHFSSTMPPKKNIEAATKRKMLRRAASRLLREADKASADAETYAQRAAQAVEDSDNDQAIMMQRISIMKKATAKKQRALSINLTVIEEVLRDAQTMKEMGTILSSVNTLLSTALETSNDGALEKVVQLFQERCLAVDVLGAKSSAAFASVLAQRGVPEQEVLDQLAPLWEAKSLEVGASIPDVVKVHLEQRDIAEAARLSEALPAAAAALP